MLEDWREWSYREERENCWSNVFQVCVLGFSGKWRVWSWLGAWLRERIEKMSTDAGRRADVVAAKWSSLECCHFLGELGGKVLIPERGWQRGLDVRRQRSRYETVIWWSRRVIGLGKYSIICWRVLKTPLSWILWFSEVVYYWSFSNWCSHSHKLFLGAPRGDKRKPRSE